MERSPKRDLLVGVFVLLGIGAIAYLSISIGGFGRHGPKGFKLSASFGETGSLTVRAPVVISGVRVGEVSKISLDNDFRAKVEMDLDPDLKLPTDTSAAIVTSGVLGDRYIELSPGSEEQLLKSGDKMAFTESAVLLERLIGQLIYGTTKGNKPGAATAPATTPQP